METYKSDADIEKEFENFTISNIEIEKRDGFSSGYITILWGNGGESVSGGVCAGSETSERWIDYDGDGEKIAFDSWFPEKVYFALCSAIREKQKA